MPQPKRLEPQHSCFGPEIPYGLDRDPEGARSRRSRSGGFMRVCAFVALAAFTAYAGYRTHTTGPGVSSDRWTGLFALSMIAFAFTALLRIPKIANSKPFKHD